MRCALSNIAFSIFIGVRKSEREKVSECVVCMKLCVFFYIHNMRDREMAGGGGWKTHFDILKRFAQLFQTLSA